MPRIRVVTDSACDIPENLVRQLEIVVLPLRLTWGSEIYLDRTGISSDETLARVRAGLIPDIEGPPVEEFSRTYRGLRESADGVISLHHSARLSDTYGNAAIAREAFGPVGAGGPFPVGVVDTQSVSMGLGWVTLAVARAAAGGMDLPKLVGLAGRLSGQSHFAFFTEHTDVLLSMPGFGPVLVAEFLGATGGDLTVFQSADRFAGVVGLMFGALFRATGSLLGPIVAHALINGVNLRFLMTHTPGSSKPLGGLLRR